MVLLGELTPEVLCLFKMHCKSYFLHKEVSGLEKVTKVAMCFQDPPMQNWYMTNEVQINAMSFKMHMAELCHMWLPSDWEATLQQRCFLHTRETPFSRNGLSTLRLSMPFYMA